MLGFRGFRAGSLWETAGVDSPRDRILWILTNNGGKMERSRLRAATGIRYALLNPILDELAREGRIRITVGKQGDLVSLISG